MTKEMLGLVAFVGKLLGVCGGITVVAAIIAFVSGDSPGRGHDDAGIVLLVLGMMQVVLSVGLLVWAEQHEASRRVPEPGVEDYR